MATSAVSAFGLVFSPMEASKVARQRARVQSRRWLHLTVAMFGGGRGGWSQASVILGVVVWDGSLRQRRSITGWYSIRCDERGELKERKGPRGEGRFGVSPNARHRTRPLRRFCRQVYAGLPVWTESGKLPVPVCLAPGGRRGERGKVGTRRELHPVSGMGMSGL